MTMHSSWRGHAGMIATRVGGAAMVVEGGGGARRERGRPLPENRHRTPEEIWLSSVRVEGVHAAGIEAGCHPGRVEGVRACTEAGCHPETGAAPPI